MARRKAFDPDKMDAAVRAQQERQKKILERFITLEVTALSFGAFRRHSLEIDAPTRPLIKRGRCRWCGLEIEVNLVDNEPALCGEILLTGDCTKGGDRRGEG
jgi:hypothetical protein